MILLQNRWAAATAVSVALLLGGCGGGDSASSSTVTSSSSSSGSTVNAAAAPALTTLGEAIFHDVSLSANGLMSCASCHDPRQAFSGSVAVPLGGPGLDQAGRRNAPSLMYLAEIPAFSFAADGTPTGGFNRDGRANSLAEQAVRPFLTSFEMANASAGDVVGRLSRASYAADFRTLFGEQIFTDVDQAFLDARLALQAYQTQAQEFAPFSSKYDAFLDGHAQLADTELRGLALFNDPLKGNCAACHPSGRRADGQHPLFTDFTYDTLGVPRNAAILANSDPTYFDLGLCGPMRTDLANRQDLCGAFRVPSLRNVALTAPYFHNGRFQTLREVVGFYVRRDTNPEEWYPVGADGLPHKFDDLPAALAGNVNTTEVPYNRHEGDAPALSATEIDDVVAFLQTLTDGYTP
jgi:cytochrome c peroxidase